ncbi:tyrosine--tRNA ligase [Ruthenibacterium sp. CLA-JM-H11]|uniref:Tyrosine--tRNA ligase n=1 Tax=Ruthenibacterium intestinale TaxID=3133163 RepID=A0ABV1GFX3_9FIRM
MENVFDLFRERGLIAQVTDEEAVRDLLGREKITFYTGFDATADSLHVGHFMQLIVMRHMQQAGHRPIILLGGGTTMVGDPTGKTDMRKMLSKEQIQHNVECFKKQMSKFIDVSEGKALFLNNADWLLNLNYIDFLREIGVHFSVNKMLTYECFKTRLERGLSFIEFNYMLMQSYDFLQLARNYDCKMEFGGNDQWSNIIGGVELNRRCDARDVYGMTFTLLTTREGKKMGKTEKGAVWLDPEKTSPYEFFQYWRNIDDCEVQNCLKLLTDVPVAEIDAIDMTDGPSINRAKERLAFELTSLVHSQEEAQKALDTARSLFGGEVDAEHMPSTVLESSLVVDGKVSLLDAMVAAKLTASKGEARRLVQHGGISVDGEKISDPMYLFSAEKLSEGVVVKKGKKVYHKISL